MSDNHDLLNDNDMCSFSGHEAEDMCFNCGDHAYRKCNFWIVNTFSDKFFKVIFAILYRRLIP